MTTVFPVALKAPSTVLFTSVVGTPNRLGRFMLVLLTGEEGCWKAGLPFRVDGCLKLAKLPFPFPFPCPLVAAT